MANYAKAEEYISEALRISRFSGDAASISNSLFQWALAAIKTREFNKAEDAIQESLRICRRLKDDRCSAERLNVLGVIYGRQGKYEQAMVALREGESIFEQLAEEIELRNIRFNIAWTREKSSRL